MNAQTLLMPINTRSGRVLVFVCLVAAILLSAMAVVSVAHASRQHFGELETQHRRNLELSAQASRLTLEYSTLAGYGRVESESARLLSMQRFDFSSAVVIQ